MATYSLASYVMRVRGISFINETEKYFGLLIERHVSVVAAVVAAVVAVGSPVARGNWKNTVFAMFATQQLIRQMCFPSPHL